MSSSDYLSDDQVKEAREVAEFHFSFGGKNSRADCVKRVSSSYKSCYNLQVYGISMHTQRLRATGVGA